MIELLDHESKWTKNANARNSKGEIVNLFSEEACCWDLIGALHKCYTGKSILYKHYQNILNHRTFIKSYGMVGKFNDKTNYKTMYNIIQDLNI